MCSVYKHTCCTMYSQVWCDYPSCLYVLVLSFVCFTYPAISHTCTYLNVGWSRWVWISEGPLYYSLSLCSFVFIFHLFCGYLHLSFMSLPAYFISTGWIYTTFMGPHGMATQKYVVEVLPKRKADTTICNKVP